jgi:hypothetical protein
VAKGQQQEKIPRRLIMLLGGRRFEEMIAAEIITEKNAFYEASD